MPCQVLATDLELDLGLTILYYAIQINGDDIHLLIESQRYSRMFMAYLKDRGGHRPAEERAKTQIMLPLLGQASLDLRFPGAQGKS